VNLKKISLWMPWRHFMEVGGIPQCIPELGTKWRWVISFKTPAALRRGKAPCTHFLRRTERNHNSVCWLTILHPIRIFVQFFQTRNFVGGRDGRDEDGDTITSVWVILWTSCKESEVIQHISYSILKQLFKTLKHFLFYKLWHNNRLYEFQWIATRSL
jgi:hypothetical protein